MSSARSRRIPVAVALSAAALLAGGYGAGQAAAAGPAPAAAHQVDSPRSGPVISVSGHAFHVPVSVRPGAVVTVVNHDATTHSVSRNGGGFGVTVPPHATRTFRAPAAVGSYAFHCRFHTEMHGTLRVRR